MTTPRDRTWLLALRLAHDTPGFSVSTVQSAAEDVYGDDETPSRGTINATLNAMADLGVLDRLGRKNQPGHYVLSDDW